MTDLNLVQTEVNEALTRNNCTLTYQIDFPTYKILPDEVKLALLILQKHGMKISFVISEKALASK